ASRRMPDRLAGWRLARPPLPPELDGHRRHRPRRGRGIHPDLHRRLEVHEEWPMTPTEETPNGGFRSFDTFSDADFKQSVWNAIRMEAIAVAIGLPILWWKTGWQSAALLVIGALISGSGLFEWLRLMTALMAR